MEEGFYWLHDGRETMNRWGLVVIAMWCGILPAFLAGHGQTEQAIPGGYVNVGQQYFVQYCAACHGIDGQGNGPVAPVLRTPPADLTRIAQRRGGQFPDAEIAALIDGRTMTPAHGSREMPVWGQRFAEKFGGEAVGEEAVRGHLLVLMQYLKSVQQ
jgi:mono/diheme cytochrome c family protein